MLRQRDTEKRAETETELEREENGTLPGSRGWAAGTPHTPVGLRSVGQRSCAAEDIRPILLYITSVSMSIKLFMAKYDRKH